MQYALLIYRNEADPQGETEAERAQVSQEYTNLKAEPEVTGGAALYPGETATTIRAQDGRLLITDGPFADTKEVFAGFYLLEADDIDRATEIASRIPALRFGGSVEIRPVVEPPRA